LTSERSADNDDHHPRKATKFPFAIFGFGSLHTGMIIWVPGLWLEDIISRSIQTYNSYGNCFYKQLMSIYYLISWESLIMIIFTSIRAVKKHDFYSLHFLGLRRNRIEK
jgi:hypothetical protein